MRFSASSPSSSRGLAGVAVHLLIVVLISLFVFDLLDQGALRKYAIDHYNGTVGYREVNWVLSSDGEVLDDHVTLHSFACLDQGTTYSISTTMTYRGRDDNAPFLFFHVHHMFCRVLLDGEELFCYTPQKIPDLGNAKSPGNVYSSVSLPKDCRGRKLEIEFSPALSGRVEYALPDVEFGDYPTVLAALFKAGLPHNLFTLFAAFLGAVAVLFSTFSLSGSDYREGIFIGIFSLLFGIYNITECPFNLYMISNPYYVYLLNYAALSLIPIAFLAFIRERFNGIQQKICTVLCAVSAGLFLLEGILHFHGIMDLREFLPILQGITFAELFIVFILLFTAKIQHRKYMLALQLLPILVGMLADVYIYYGHWNSSTSDTAFTNIGVLIFMTVELRHVWQSSVNIYTESIRSHQYHQMAFVDSLTAVGNRRAYEAEKEKILSGKRTGRSLLVVSVDVNNLKIVNDTMGHSAGDYLIRSTANVLTDLAENAGQVFRTGGDEFMIFLYNIDQQEFEQRRLKTRERIRELNETSDVNLSIALGYEFVAGNDLEQAIQSADKKMYADKAEKKKSLASSPSVGFT